MFDRDSLFDRSWNIASDEPETDLVELMDSAARRRAAWEGDSETDAE